MNNMTTEEKAKAYDEAIINGSRLWECGKITRENYEYIFPELKELENERMVKFIKNQLFNIKKTITDNYELDAKLTKAIDWLEKQAEHANFRNKIQIGDKVTRNRDGILVNLSQLNRVAKDEKQGEQNPNNKVEPKFKVGDYIERKDGLGCHAKIIFVGGNVYGCEKLIHSEDESPFFEFMFKNQDEFQISSDFKQKSAYNVEPKFHEGDWLCENEPNNYARFIQILEIVNVQGKYRYRISRDIHKDEDVVEFGFVEKYYHKFDTQDAKDGDALFVKPTENLGKQLIIFGGIDSNGRIKYYCRFLNNKFSINGGLMGYDHKYFLPATKEQRDTLFKAMANAGYEWDADKKELKKIEQKFTWSEEDEEMFGYALDMIEWYSGKNENKSRAVSDWLKSLRPQNTWKPSDEQLEYLLTIKTLSPSPLLESLYVDLKKLMEE